MYPFLYTFFLQELILVDNCQNVAFSNIWIGELGLSVAPLQVVGSQRFLGNSASADQRLRPDRDYFQFSYRSRGSITHRKQIYRCRIDSQELLLGFALSQQNAWRIVCAVGYAQQLLYLICIFAEENACNCCLLATHYLTRHFCEIDP